MGKITTLLLMMSGLDLLFWFSGLLKSSNNLLTQLLNPSVILTAGIVVTSATTLGTIVFNLFVSGAGINIGNIFSNLRYALVIPFVAYIVKLFGDSMVIFTTIGQVNAVLAVLFLSPIFIVIILAIYALLDSGITV